MLTARTIDELRQTIAHLKQDKLREGVNGQVGLVPTMGYLHEGHASLMERARMECGIVVLSVFVNPLQFGPNEDFEHYPRDEKRDLELAASCGVDIVFIPDVKEMYPRNPRTTVSVSGITEQLCGASRPGHFDGVCTVVSKLFHLVGPDFAYFGMKDAQQVAVIEQMVYDLNMCVKIVRCQTLRETDGLAKSSRNVYLNADERSQAVVLSRALASLEVFIQEEKGNAEAVRRRVMEMIRQEPLAEIDYVEIISYPEMEPIQTIPFPVTKPVLTALAVKFGKTRLIDNRLMHPNGERR